MSIGLGLLTSSLTCCPELGLSTTQSSYAKSWTRCCCCKPKKLQSLQVLPGSELHKWQTVLSNRGNPMSGGTAQAMQTMGRKWCDDAKLRCLIRGAKLSGDDACTTVQDKLYQMDKETSEVTFNQYAGEYSRASEMYAYVSSVVGATFAAATLRSGKKKAAATSPEAPAVPKGKAATRKLGGVTLPKPKPKKQPAELFTTVNSSESPARKRQGRRLFSEIQEDLQQLRQLVQDTPITEPVIKDLQEQPPTITREKIAAAQKADEQIQAVVSALGLQGTDKTSKYLHKWAARNHELDEEGVLVRLYHLPAGRAKRVDWCRMG